MSAVLQTERLILRDFRDADEERVVTLFADPLSQGQILRAQRNSKHMAYFVREAIKYAEAVDWSARAHFMLAAEVRETKDVVGICSITDATPHSSAARLGWHIGDHFSGRGYATEIARELIRFSFRERGVARAFADCFESNKANVRVFRKTGMQPCRGLFAMKWLLALSYREGKPIVRYAIKGHSDESSSRA